MSAHKPAPWRISSKLTGNPDLPRIWRITHQHDGILRLVNCPDCWRNYQALSGAEAIAAFARGAR